MLMMRDDRYAVAVADAFSRITGGSRIGVCTFQGGVNAAGMQYAYRGIQYAAEAYRRALVRSGITPSMCRKGDCLDNAPMESFFHTLKTERVHHRVYATRTEARRDLFHYIEGFYNSRRLHSALGYLSPAHAERIAA